MICQSSRSSRHTPEESQQSAKDRTVYQLWTWNTQLSNGQKGWRPLTWRYLSRCHIIKIIKKAHGCQTHQQLSTILNLHLDIQCGDRPQPGSESRSLVSVRSSLWKVSISLPCGSDGKESACNAEDPGLIPGSGRSPGERNGYPLQYSCLGNYMVRESWWITVHGVAKLDTTHWLTLSLWSRLQPNHSGTLLDKVKQLLNPNCVLQKIFYRCFRHSQLRNKYILSPSYPRSFSRFVYLRMLPLIDTFIQHRFLFYDTIRITVRSPNQRMWKVKGSLWSDPCFAKCYPQTRHLGINWDLIRSTESQVHLRTCESEATFHKITEGSEFTPKSQI